MIGISHGVGRHLPRPLPRQSMLIQQKSHQLGNSDGWMGVIELKNILLSKPFEVVTMERYPFAKDVLKTG